MQLNLIIHALLFQIFLSNGCGLRQQSDKEMNKLPVIILNGNKIIAGEETSRVIIREIESLLDNCDDFYEMIVTEQIIGLIKEEKTYLEIIFPEKVFRDAGRFNNLKFNKMLIPLKGKFYSAGQVTFFTGYDGYWNTPVMNSNGSLQIQEVLKKISY